MTAQTRSPNDAVALYFTPVALTADDWLEHHSALSTDEVRSVIALATNMESSERPGHKQALVDEDIQSLPAHGWALAVTPRGPRVTHRTHAVPLGPPRSERTALDG